MTFTDLLSLVINSVTNPCGSMPVDELADVFAAVTPRGERPRALRQGLTQLGYDIRGNQIHGLSLRGLNHYVREMPGATLEVADLIESVPRGVEQRYVTLLASTVAADGLLYDLSL